MAAARVGPQAAAVVFLLGTSVKQQVSLAVEDKHTERPMKHALAVSFHLFHSAQGPIFRIYQNHIFDHGMFVFERE